MNDNHDDTDEEELYPHRHNFSALDYIQPRILTEQELNAENEKKRVMELIHEYDMLFDGMERLMYESYLNGENLDEAYGNLKNWCAFM